MAVGSTARRGIDALGNVLRIVGMLIVTVLVVHIVLTLLGANPENGLTQLIRDAADTFNLGLSDLFLPADPRLGVVLKDQGMRRTMRTTTVVITNQIRAAVP